MAFVATAGTLAGASLTGLACNMETVVRIATAAVA